MRLLNLVLVSQHDTMLLSKNEIESIRVGSTNHPFKTSIFSTERYQAMPYLSTEAQRALRDITVIDCDVLHFTGQSFKIEVKTHDISKYWT